MRINIFRKLLRLSSISIPLLYFFSSKYIVLVLIFILLAIFLLIEIWRFRRPELNNYKILNLFLKKEERANISAITLFVISCFFTVLFFSKKIAIAALFFSIFGDALAGITGLKLGRIRLIGHKTLEGSLACFIGNLLIGFVLIKKVLDISSGTIILGSFTATIAELIPLRIGRFSIDDNLSISLLTGLVMSLVL